MRLKVSVAAVAALMFAAPGFAQHQNLPSSGVKVTEPHNGSAALTTPALDPENMLDLDLSSGGRVVIQLRPDVAPHHVERIKTLARQGFYNGLIFHRVIEGFMAQGGDPKGDGTGGSPLPDLQAEFNPLPHVRGAVAAARSEDENSANSQFFIMFAPRLSLDGKYTVFGRVVSGMQYVDAIQRGEPPSNPTKIMKASIEADHVPPPSAAEIAAAAAAPPAAPRAQVAIPAPAPADANAQQGSAPAPGAPK